MLRTYYPKLLNSNLYIQFDKKDKIKLKLLVLAPNCIYALWDYMKNG